MARKFPAVAATPAAARIRARFTWAGIEKKAMYTQLHRYDFGAAKGALPLTESLSERAFNLLVPPARRRRQRDRLVRLLRRMLGSTSRAGG